MTSTAKIDHDQDQLTASHPLAVGRLTEHVARAAAEHGVPDPSPAVASLVRQDILANIYYTNRPQPLGICLYPSASVKDERGKTVHNELHDPDPTRPGRPYEVVYSRYYPLGTYTHRTATGPCEHEMYVDDGGIYTVEPDPLEGYLVKTGRATCLHSLPRRDSDKSPWHTVDVWQVPCPAGDWLLTTKWRPADTRYTADSEEKNRAPEDMVLCEARPVGRSDLDKFAATGNYRNVSESHNSFYKRSLPHARATSPHQRAQEFDFFAGACLTNAITWATSRE